MGEELHVHIIHKWGRFLMGILENLAKAAVKGGKFAFEKVKESAEKMREDRYECEQKYGDRVYRLSDEEIMKKCTSGPIGYRTFFLEEAKRRGLINR